MKDFPCRQWSLHILYCATKHTVRLLVCFLDDFRGGNSNSLPFDRLDSKGEGERICIGMSNERGEKKREGMERGERKGEGVYIG